MISKAEKPPNEDTCVKDFQVSNQSFKVPCHSCQQDSSFIDQPRALNLVFGPLLLGPFLTCCHLSQCQLPQSPRALQTAWLCLPAKPELPMGGSPGARRGCPHHQLPIGFLLFSSRKLPSSHALPTDAVGSALCHVQGQIWLQVWSCSCLSC